MNKLKLFLLIAFVPLCVCSCGDDNEEEDENSALQALYQKTKANIIGTWVLDAEFNNVVGPNTLGSKSHLGWDSNDPYEIFPNLPYYKYTFKSDGTFTDKNGETYTYNIQINEKEAAYYTRGEDSEYWPFKKGVIVLKFDDAYYEKAYVKEFYIEIRDDNMLYLYSTSLGKSGLPKYRYKRQ